jgi:G protein-coupled receptor kinase
VSPSEGDSGCVADMAMDIENIVANTVLVKARHLGDRGRSKKWKEMLRLPPVAQCLWLRDELDHTYEFLVEQQPIGQELFHQFCAREHLLNQCTKFLEEVAGLKLLVDEKFAAAARSVFATYLAEGVRLEVVGEELTVGVETKLSVRPVPRDLFATCVQEARMFLSGQPFVDYVNSPFYWRYLQWKYLEKMPITKNNFRVYRVLGKGGFGLVYACQSKTTGKMYALKKLEKKRVKRRHGEKLALNEKQVLERVSSRFVVSLVYAYQSKDALCMILTLMGGGDLRFHIHNVGEPGLSEPRTVFYAAEIACGLAHLHQARIAYRDMKPDNILLDDRGHVRISDLGLAVHIPEGQSVRGRVGTVGYMAPEVIGNHRYTFQPDWWGLGCMVYEMVHGECPFRQRKERVTRDDVEQRIKEEREHYTAKFTDDAKLFCSQLLDKDSSTRLGCGPGGFSTVQAHPFFQYINWSHLLAGQVGPPFKPNEKAVYARDVLDIDPFSSVKGVEMDGSDSEFASKFSTGAVSEPWQEEVGSAV